MSRARKSQLDGGMDSENQLYRAGVMGHLRYIRRGKFTLYFAYIYDNM